MNAATARETCGLTLEQAARWARVSPAYLRRLERSGIGFPYALAVRLASFYARTTGNRTAVSLNDFLRHNPRENTTAHLSQTAHAQQHNINEVRAKVREAHRRSPASRVASPEPADNSVPATITPLRRAPG